MELEPDTISSQPSSPFRGDYKEASLAISPVVGSICSRNENPLEYNSSFPFDVEQTSATMSEHVDAMVLHDLRTRDGLLQRQLNALLDDMDVYGKIHSTLADMLKDCYHCTEYEVQILQALGFVDVQAFCTAAAKPAHRYIASFPRRDIEHPKVIAVLSKAYCVGILFRCLASQMSDIKTDEITSHRFSSVVTEDMAQDTLQKNYRNIKSILQEYVSKLGHVNESITGSTLQIPNTNRFTGSITSHQSSSSSSSSSHSKDSAASHPTMHFGHTHTFMQPTRFSAHSFNRKIPNRLWVVVHQLSHHSIETYSVNHFHSVSNGGDLS